MSDDGGLFNSKGVPVPLEGVKVYGDIIGRGAKVKICQHFRNIEHKSIEAVYRFPLPESATICGFRAIVGNKIVEGEIEEREKAFDLYHKALSKGHGAQLMDQERPNIFTLSVGSIRPGGSIVIEISYIELMDSDNAEVRFFLPTTISPRYTPANQPDKNGIPVKDIVNPPILLEVPYGLNININIHDRMGISLIESPSHFIRTNFTDTAAIVSFTSEEATMDKDFILNVAYGKVLANRGFLYKDQNGTFIQVDLTADIDVATDKADDADSGREIVFVLDCSGSMGGESINEAKKALNIAVKALKPGMMFNFYLFGSSFNSLYSQSKAYDNNTLNEALKYLNKASASLGGTEVLGPLKDIYSKVLKEGCHRDILFITDGEISNEEQIMNLVKDHADHTTVYTVGIGSGPNEFLVKGMARVSGGASEMVAPREKIEPKILKLFSKVLAGRIRDIQINWNAEVQQAPEKPVLFQGQNSSIFAQLKDADQEIKSLNISGNTISGMKEWVVDIQPATEKDLAVSKLWARERIRDLEEGHEAQNGSQQKERVDVRTAAEIIEISKKYGIISSKTSFIGIEMRSKSEKSNSKIVLRKVPAMLTTGWGGLQQTGHGTTVSKKALSSHVLAMPMAHEDREYCEFPTSHRKQDDPLKSILSLHRSDGGFDFGKPLEELLKLSPSDIERIAGRIEEDLRHELRIVTDILTKMMSNTTIERDMDRCNEILKQVQHKLSDEGANKYCNTIKKDFLQFTEATGKFSEIVEKHIRYLIDIDKVLRKLNLISIVTTMIVLLLLEAKFYERKPEWKQIVKGSRDWLDEQFQKSMLIDQRKAEGEIRGFVKTRLKAG